MSEQDIQEIASIAIQSALKTKAKWYVTTILSIVVGFTSTIFAIGLYAGKLDGWKDNVDKTLDRHETSINNILNRYNKRSAEYNQSISTK